jgi:hypothetical protein
MGAGSARERGGSVEQLRGAVAGATVTLSDPDLLRDIVSDDCGQFDMPVPRYLSLNTIHFGTDSDLGPTCL